MARIRTIKPEFWQNETLAGLPAHARLLAIALLNNADDDGYFLANASLVRAACFPFEECSENVRGSLQELSRIGYIEVRDCDGKQIGRVVKFKDHQRIDKPQKSKLHDVFNSFSTEKPDSKNVPGTIQESSKSIQRLEWNGMEQGKEMEREREGERKTPLSLSKHCCSEDFRKAWSLWLRKQQNNRKGIPVDDATEESQLFQLQRFSTEEAIEVVRFSASKTNCVNLIVNGDHKNKPTQAKPVKQTLEELLS
jgi:hypothetical protein